MKEKFYTVKSTRPSVVCGDADRRIQEARQKGYGRRMVLAHRTKMAGRKPGKGRKR